jgi:hypothetical protein
VTVLIQAPFADVRGDALRWALDLPPQAALASHEVPLADGRTVGLQVLGASHQVLVRRGDDVLLSETVACDLADAVPLPARTRRTGYRFDSRVERLAPEPFRTRVAGLVERLDADPQAIVAGFPGTPYAVTAIAVDSTGPALAWQTWHAYPQTGELIHTTTRLHPMEDADA